MDNHIISAGTALMALLISIVVLIPILIIIEARKTERAYRRDIAQWKARAEHAEAELRAVDAALERRLALDKFTTRSEKIRHACMMAGKAERL